MTESLADVLTAALPDEALIQLSVECDHPFATTETVRAYLLSAILPPLQAREQTLREDIARFSTLADERHDEIFAAHRQRDNVAGLLVAAEARVSSLTAELDALKRLAADAVFEVGFAGGYIGVGHAIGKNVNDRGDDLMRQSGEPSAQTPEKHDA